MALTDIETNCSTDDKPLEKPKDRKRTMKDITQLEKPKKKKKTKEKTQPRDMILPTLVILDLADFE